MLPKTYKEIYMTPIHALIFQEHVQKCVYIKHIKKLAQIYNMLGKYMQQNRLAGRSFLQKLGLHGPGA